MICNVLNPAVSFFLYILNLILTHHFATVGTALDTPPPPPPLRLNEQTRGGLAAFDQNQRRRQTSTHEARARTTVMYRTGSGRVSRVSLRLGFSLAWAKNEFWAGWLFSLTIVHRGSALGRPFSLDSSSCFFHSLSIFTLVDFICLSSLMPEEPCC
ncbi:hypothetical protein LX32DRAFT_341560 [Colletotrichum zoysiae]|uniref:Uncharacterized protein n=1 Tax=Colletotrichum zoysiae TaxID=1216348 RepID=A0AAD9M203_9PEZI|nr:hypothetical protein LX32DRAFT_341560 [Colletotrichum zoysiae]